MARGAAEQPSGRSVAAYGKHAAFLTEHHDLSDIFGDTSLHLADARAEYPGKHLVTESSAMMVDGKREWVSYRTLAVDGEDFEEIGRAFEQQGTAVRKPLGNSSVCLMRQRELVDFAVSWIEKNRRS